MKLEGWGRTRNYEGQRPFCYLIRRLSQLEKGEKRNSDERERVRWLESWADSGSLQNSMAPLKVQKPHKDTGLLIWPVPQAHASDGPTGDVQGHLMRK